MTNVRELSTIIDAYVDYQSTLQHVEIVVIAYPDLYRDVLTYLRERTNEVLTGTSASIIVRMAPT